MGSIVENTDEQDLADVQAVLDGDQDAFERIVQRHSEAITRQIRGFSRDAGVIEEIAHEVFVEAYLGLASFRGDAPLRHWLARIATLTGYKYWRHRDKQKKNAPLHELAEQAAPEPPASAGSPEQAAQLLFDLLAQLPTDDRLVLTLMYLEKAGQEEIARRMGWSRVAVAVRIHRAKAKLRKLGDKEPWKGRLQWILS